MRTVIIIMIGLAILAASTFAGGRFGGAATMVSVAKIFIPLWVVAALANMWMGVSRAGYSVAAELPVFLVILIVPTAAAAWIWWKYS